ncbi:hypothetical protein [Kitasatospora sp. NPDC088783]|uniref:deazapurine DNA modification protein DpdA family protein n=1 Tax=Kitasatospora sp. NPDC088783 TaxID=3364077 RepID=UPI0038092B3F
MTVTAAPPQPAPGAGLQIPRFWLGIHHPNWLERTDIPLFVSNPCLNGRKSFPRARGPWVLDSGAYSELALHGGWRITEAQYAARIRLYRQEIDNLAWTAPLDFPCETDVLRKTGLSAREHARLTVDSVLELRHLGEDVIPVLQGWTAGDYRRCEEMYEKAGIDLEAEPIVGVGTMCKRQNSLTAVGILDVLARKDDRGMPRVNLHAFGFSKPGLRLAGANTLASADSMAWSSAGRHERGCAPGHQSEANCLPFALAWREELIGRLEDDAAARHVRRAAITTP